MKRIFPVITTVTLLALVPSCATSKHPTGQGDPPLAVLATSSAFIVALPLIPLALPFNAIHEAHERKVEKRLQDVLDPVYEKRITMIQARDPVADAGQAWSDGTRAFLPTVSAPRGCLFPGLEKTGFNFNKQFGLENCARLQQSEFLQYLETLMSKDPVQIQNRNIPYLTETYKRFNRVCWNYREAFNKEMYRRNASPDKSP